MIAHLIFEESRRPSGIFIIDEPELSLHLAWQEIFVDSISKASPKTQFILATHSPTIISIVEREKKLPRFKQTKHIKT
jgi:predicted ATP-binding protein involved in virulence